MGFVDWARRSRDRLHERGYGGLSESAYEVYAGAWRYLGWRVPRGTNVYEREWDVLVVLDACRVDLMEDVGGEYSFLGDVGSLESVGSMSEEWLAKTFTDEYAPEMGETAYVTANVFSDAVLDPGDFAVLDEVWRYRWDDETGTVPPADVTDRAIDAAREHDPEYLIVHYMQPHHPFVGSELFGEFGVDQFGERDEVTVVDALRTGDVSREAFWAAYRDTLRLVLDELSVLVENVDADPLAITSDHGEALGEWGVYGHPAGCLHPAVTRVPWVETTATDTGAYEPALEPSIGMNPDVDERLRDLGYR